MEKGSDTLDTHGIDFGSVMKGSHYNMIVYLCVIFRPKKSDPFIVYITDG